MITKEQLNIHSLKKLKQEISKTNLKGYSKLKKIDLIALMMTKPERFNHLGTHSMPNGTQMTGATHDSKSKPTKKIIKKKAKESPPPKASPPPKPKLTKEEVKKKVKKVIKKRAEAKPEPKAEESDLGSLYKHGIGNASKAELGDMFDKLSQNVNKELEKMKTAKKDYFKVIKVRGGKQYHTEAAAILVEDQKEIQKALERYIETHGIKDSGVQEMIKKFNKLANSAMTRMRKAKGKALERVGLI